MLPEVPKSFMVWFYAAACYNVLWGLAMVLCPRWLMAALGLQGLIYPQLLQVIGMMVGVFGYGYYLLARAPLRYCGFIWIGIAGKLCGVLGFLFYALRAELPWMFGLTIVTNDLIWLPVFLMFAFRFAMRPLD
jgi:hypothetical protein